MQRNMIWIENASRKKSCQHKTIVSSELHMVLLSKSHAFYSQDPLKVGKMIWTWIHKDFFHSVCGWQKWIQWKIDVIIQVTAFMFDELFSKTNQKLMSSVFEFDLTCDVTSAILCYEIVVAHDAARTYGGNAFSSSLFHASVPF